MRTVLTVVSSVLITLLVQSFALQPLEAKSANSPMRVDELHVRKLVVEASPKSAYRAVLEGSNLYAKVVVEQRQLISPDPLWAGIWAYTQGPGPAIGLSDGYPSTGWDFAIGLVKGEKPHIQVRNDDRSKVHVFEAELPLRVRKECLTPKSELK